MTSTLEGPSDASAGSPHSTSLVSGEGVAFDLDHAGVGSRMIAATIDVLVQLGAVLVLAYLDSAFVAASNVASVAALLVVELVLIVLGYPVLCEWLLRGRTVGKSAMGLRVVRDDGGPIGFRQALVRGLAGLVIEKPGLLFPVSTAAGILTMIFEPRTKRIGDLMAGTFVLNERAGGSSLPAFLPPVPWELQQWSAHADLSALDDRLALAMRQLVSRATIMTPDARASLEAQLHARLAAVVTPAPPAGTPTAWILVALLAERRRRATPVPVPPPGQPWFTVPGPTPGPQNATPPTVPPAVPPPPVPPADPPFAPPR